MHLIVENVLLFILKECLEYKFLLCLLLFVSLGIGALLSPQCATPFLTWVLVASSEAQILTGIYFFDLS